MDTTIIRQMELLVGSPYDDPAEGIISDDAISTPKVAMVPGDHFDCMTLARRCYELAGRVFPMPAVYRAGMIPDDVLERWAAFWEPCEPEPLAIVSFADDEGFRHVGTMLDAKRVIHASAKLGVVIHRLGFMRPHVQGIYRLRGVQ